MRKWSCPPTYIQPHGRQQAATIQSMAGRFLNISWPSGSSCNSPLYYFPWTVSFLGLSSWSCPRSAHTDRKSQLLTRSSRIPYILLILGLFCTVCIEYFIEVALIFWISLLPISLLMKWLPANSIIKPALLVTVFSTALWAISISRGRCDALWG